MKEREFGRADGPRIDVHDSLADADARWRSPERESELWVFQRPAFVEHFVNSLGRAAGSQPFLVELRDDDRLILLLPLALRRAGPITVLEGLGGRVADYHAPVLAVDAALAPDTARRSWSDILAALPPVDVIAFDKMPARVGSRPNPVLAMLDAEPEARMAHAATLGADFPTWLRGKRSAKFLKDKRNQWRRLQDMGRIEVVLDPPPALRARIADALIAQKSRRWIETGCRDLFALPGYREFYAPLIRGEVMPECSHTSALLLDGEPIACHWGLVDQERFYYILPTHAAGPTLRYSPGVHLLMALFEWAIHRGIGVFDFTVGDEAYKQDWCDQEMPLWRYREARTWRGRAYLAQEKLRERARRTTWLRDAVRATRHWGRVPDDGR